MSQPSPFTAAPKAQRLAQARRLLNPPTRRPAAKGVTADTRFITAAGNYRRTAKAYMAAVGAWQAFTLTHPHDDPAHEEFGRRVLCARQALNAADEAFSIAEAGL